jgi:aconitate hydratase
VLAPQYLGLRLVLAKSFARIHYQNLVNAGILALVFQNPEDYDRLDQEDVLEVEDVHGQIDASREVIVRVPDKDLELRAEHRMSERQRDIFHVGGLINWLRRKKTA